MPIVVLAPEVAAEIAAGEVIERPASAVKELVENALDAGATAVSVEIERGGLDLIRVTDDGRGMSAAELALAIQRHATSKLRTAADLQGVLTLGFRGEALPSLAAAGELTIRSRAAGAMGGAEIDVREGRPGPVVAVGAPAGTSVTLRDLFGRQPARRKFLRTSAGETAQIAQLLSQLALAYPSVRFALTVDGRTTLSTSGGGDRREVAGRVFGAAAGRRLLEVGDGDEPGISVEGLVSPPDLSRGTRSAVHLTVNGRVVQSRRLTFAVESAYETLLTTGRHPIAVIEVRLAPEELDVNVHPTKAEVRFRDERAVFRAVQGAVRRAVIGGAPVPRLGPAGADGATAAEAAVGEPSLWGAQASPNQVVIMSGTVESGTPEETPRSVGETLPLVRVVGQVGSTYIVGEGPDGMYLIDQHAAHERVLYEQLVAQRHGAAVETQGLLAPVNVELTAAQGAVFGAAQAGLAELGFDVEPFGERAVVVRSVPAVYRGRDPGASVAELLEALAAPEAASPEGADRATMTVACHAAVRAGMTLALEEMRALIRQLERCRSPRTCPHGRPTVMHLSATTLDREFRRR